MTGTENTKCGFVALIGAPNAGKSTLINKLVGEKISIVSRKVQTTRSRVCGIVNRENVQIVFVDTPGIFNPKKRLDRAMVDAAWKSVNECEQVVLTVDVSNPKALVHHADIIAMLKKTGRKVILCLNKIDCIDKETLLPIADAFFKTEAFSDVVMISALHGHGTERIVELVSSRMPDGPHLFPDDTVSDMPLRLVAAEITREKIFDRLHQEIPYEITVETEKWEEDDKKVVIDQVVYVRKDGQKAIVLGKGGSAIKSIGIESRKELEKALEKHVRLNIFVKVRENWQDDPGRYAMWGLSFDA